MSPIRAIFIASKVRQAKHVFAKISVLTKEHTRFSLSRSFSSTASLKTLDISGIFPPIPTPFNKDESIAFDKLELNMEKWNNIPFKGYVVQGSTGECCFLTWEERIQMVKETSKLAGDNKIIIAGSGCESTRDTILLSQKMADAGADAVLVVNPFYYKASMNATALISHFTKVADEALIPVILYNVPSNTGMDIPADVIVQLAQHPNIIGMKDSGGDITRIASLVYQTASYRFQILAGSAGFLLSAYHVGCVGGICGAANVLGSYVCELADLAQSDNLKAATDLQLRLVGPNSCVTRRFGVPGVKTAMEWFGYYGGPTRLPLVPLNPNEVAAMKKIFQASMFI